MSFVCTYPHILIASFIKLRIYEGRTSTEDMSMLDHIEGITGRTGGVRKRLIRDAAVSKIHVLFMQMNGPHMVRHTCSILPFAMASGHSVEFAVKKTLKVERENDSNWKSCSDAEVANNVALESEIIEKFVFMYIVYCICFLWRINSYLNRWASFFRGSRMVSDSEIVTIFSVGTFLNQKKHSEEADKYYNTHSIIQSNSWELLPSICFLNISLSKYFHSSLYTFNSSIRSLINFADSTNAGGNHVCLDCSAVQSNLKSSKCSLFHLWLFHELLPEVLDSVAAGQRAQLEVGQPEHLDQPTPETSLLI